MPRVYPRASETKPDILPVDEASCVAAIIQAKDDDLTKAQAVGICLAGSDDVAGFNRLWDRVDAQVIAARAVNPTDGDTVIEYKTAVASAASLLDATLWYNGLKAEAGVGTFSELTSKVEELTEVVEPKGL